MVKLLPSLCSLWQTYHILDTCNSCLYGYCCLYVLRNTFYVYCRSLIRLFPCFQFFSSFKKFEQLLSKGSYFKSFFEIWFVRRIKMHICLGWLWRIRIAFLLMITLLLLWPICKFHTNDHLNIDNHKVSHSPGSGNAIYPTYLYAVCHSDETVFRA